VCDEGDSRLKQSRTERETGTDGERRKTTDAEEVLLVFCVRSMGLCAGRVKKEKARKKGENEKVFTLSDCSPGPDR
jgi:hypothetical protein